MFKDGYGPGAALGGGVAGTGIPLLFLAAADQLSAGGADEAVERNAFLRGVSFDFRKQRWVEVDHHSAR